MKIKKILSFISIISILFSPAASLAQVTYYETLNPQFNPNRIIDDTFINDYNSLTLEEIKRFLDDQGGTLGRYVDPSTQQPAFWLIWNTAQEYRINPKFIMIMLQKEQSLITDDSPTENQYNWAVGYSCYGGVCLDVYKGFAKQIQAMANKIVNSYLSDLKIKGKYTANFYCTFTKWCVGVAKMTQDEQLIIPENKITAALYTYNPYQGGTITKQGRVGANYNFWKIWDRWFNQLTLRPTSTLLKTAGSDVVYLIQNGKKRPFANFSALATRYDPKKIMIVGQNELDQYQLGDPIKFSQYSLLANDEGKIFLLVDDTLRQIADMEVFRTLGFNPEEVETVSSADLAGLKIGRPITISSSYPTGALITDSSTGGVYWVQAGEKFPIMAPEILRVNYPDRKILSARPEELEKYPKGEAIKFKEGTLIKSRDSEIVYFVSGGKKLPIASEQAFVSRGYSWSDVVETNQVAVEMLLTGPALEPIDLSGLKQTAPAPVLDILPDSATTSTSTLN
ncbi:MAG: hypothetical protein Q8P32_02040 [Candidatus Komeilibacteria bacterium]|nr:hypothetical protein [Candidatus Komeilibacteria bacterium]